jgi:hypothetical protein
VAKNVSGWKVGVGSSDRAVSRGGAMRTTFFGFGVSIFGGSIGGVAPTSAGIGRGAAPGTGVIEAGLAGAAAGVVGAAAGVVGAAAGVVGAAAAGGGFGPGLAAGAVGGAAADGAAAGAGDGTSCARAAAVQTSTSAANPPADTSRNLIALPDHLKSKNF